MKFQHRIIIKQFIAFSVSHFQKVGRSQSKFEEKLVYKNAIKVIKTQIMASPFGIFHKIVDPFQDFLEKNHQGPRLLCFCNINHNF